MSRFSFLAAGLAAPLLLAAPLALGQASPQAQPGGACRADVERLCPGIQPGRGRIAQCLRGKEDQVSAECQAHIEAMKQRFQAAVEACKPDVERFCQGIEPGGGRIGQCLREHRDELSEACQAQRHH